MAEPRREAEDGATGATTVAPAAVSLRRLLQVFTGIGLTSFGGGRVAYFWHALVVRHRWLSDADLLEGVALSQLLPGPNIGNLSVYLGRRLRGGPGAVLAIAGVLLPGFVMMLALAALYFTHGQVPAVAPLYAGIGAGATGLALSSTVSVGRRAVQTPVAAALMVLTFIGIAILHLNTFIVIAPLAVVGIMIGLRRLPPAAAE